MPRATWRQPRVWGPGSEPQRPSRPSNGQKQPGMSLVNKGPAGELPRSRDCAVVRGGPVFASPLPSPHTLNWLWGQIRWADTQLKCTISPSLTPPLGGIRGFIANYPRLERISILSQPMVSGRMKKNKRQGGGEDRERGRTKLGMLFMCKVYPGCLCVD